MRAITVGVVVFLLGGCAAGAAETVDVKYRGPVALDHFACSSIERGSFIRRVCYDRADAYMIVQLNDTYYHYCDIDKPTVDAFLSAESMGRYFGTSAEFWMNLQGRYELEKARNSIGRHLQEIEPRQQAA